MLVVQHTGGPQVPHERSEPGVAGRAPPTGHRTLHRREPRGAGVTVAEPQPQTPYVPYAGGQTYFYYPAYELYYYPSSGELYWYRDNKWRHNRKIPDRFRNVVSVGL